MLIKEALDRAVNVVKWFILILVIVFDPLAVTLVIAYNASLLRIKNGEPEELSEKEGKSKSKAKACGLLTFPFS